MKIKLFFPLLILSFIFVGCLDMGGGGTRSRGDSTYVAPTVSVIASDVCLYVLQDVPEGCECDPSSGEAVILCEGYDDVDTCSLMSVPSNCTCSNGVLSCFNLEGDPEDPEDPLPTCSPSTLGPGETCSSSESSCCKSGQCISGKCACNDTTALCPMGTFCNSVSKACQNTLGTNAVCSYKEQCSSGWCYHSGNQDPMANPPSGATGVCKPIGTQFADGALCNASSQCTSQGGCGGDGKCGKAAGQACSYQVECRRPNTFCERLSEFPAGITYSNGYYSNTCQAGISVNVKCGSLGWCSYACSTGQWYCDNNLNGSYDAGEPVGAECSGGISAPMKYRCK